MTLGEIWAITQKRSMTISHPGLVKKQLDLELGSDDVPFKRILNNWKVL